MGPNVMEEWRRGDILVSFWVLFSHIFDSHLRIVDKIDHGSRGSRKDATPYRYGSGLYRI